MMFQNAKFRSWTINHVYLSDMHVQLGRLGSGSIVEGRSWSNGYLIYLPLSANCEYLANGTAIQKGSFLILEPGCDFCVATTSKHDWCSIFVPTNSFADADEENSSETEETNVTDVLFGHGVSELGRFASRYGALFGELPSETLRAKRR